jgi:hypothetical protein
VTTPWAGVLRTCTIDNIRTHTARNTVAPAHILTCLRRLGRLVESGFFTSSAAIYCSVYKAFSLSGLNPVRNVIISAMLDIKIRDKIVAHTKRFWEEHVTTKQFTDLASGKEIGHRIADYVDDQTVSYLKVDSGVTVTNEVDVLGQTIKRSMGDLWIFGNGIYNPINIKSGITTNGNPNVVSLAKLIDRLFKHQIDSYYLLIVKTPLVDGSIVGTTPKVFLIDLLDYLDFVNFDAGPGQVMLKEKELYAELLAGTPPVVLSTEQKVQKCMAIMEDGYRRLIINRERQLAKYRDNLGLFSAADIDQEGLRFG